MVHIAWYALVTGKHQSVLNAFLLYSKYQSGIWYSLCLQTSTNAIYQQLYQGVMSDPANLVGDGEDGVKKTMQEKYAYMAETTYLQLTLSENCQLSMIKEKFFASKHAFVIPRGWLYKKYFDTV